MMGLTKLHKSPIRNTTIYQMENSFYKKNRKNAIPRRKQKLKQHFFPIEIKYVRLKGGKSLSKHYRAPRG